MANDPSGNGSTIKQAETTRSADKTKPARGSQYRLSGRYNRPTREANRRKQTCLNEADFLEEQRRKTMAGY